MTATITLNPKKCSACGHCQATCPKAILEIQRISSREKAAMTFFQRLDAAYHKNKKLVITEPERCLGCGLCIRACRHSALSLQEIPAPSGSASVTLPRSFSFSSIICAAPLKRP